LTIADSGPVAASHYAFLTSKERDSESALDYYGARYCSSAQGRFTSVDPGNAGAMHEDPQSWNGYSYGRDNPLIYIDPTGEDYAVYINGEWYQVADATDFEKLGYKTYDLGDKSGNTIGVTDAKGKNYTAVYVAGNPGKPEQATQPDPTAELIANMQLRAPAMNTAIDIVAAVNLAPVVILGGAEVLTAGGGLTELGLTAGTEAAEGTAAEVTVSQATREAFQRQLAQQGRQSLEKSLRSLEKRLAEHLEKLPRYKDAGGHTSSVETEIQQFKAAIKAIKDILGK
jgi:RHS repeat-associated protein